MAPNSPSSVAPASIRNEDTKVKFLVAVFPAGKGKAGIVFADFNTDAPKDITDQLNKMFASIKVKG